MSSSSPPELEIEHTDKEDPLNLLDDKIRDFKDVEIEDKFNSVKRKLVSDVHVAKKPKIKEENENLHSECEKENHNPPSTEENSKDDSKIKEEPLSNEEEEYETGNEIKLTEKDSKLDEDETDSKNEAISKDKKDKKENDKKVQNLRKNIKDVIDESHLDATTLAAQRQESERLARLQEAQRVVRETQRQIAAEKHANKTQQKVLSLLGDQSNEQNNSTIDLDDPLFEKLSLNPAISITPACKETLQSIQSLISTDEKIPDSDDDVIIQPEEPFEKSKAVIVDSSSDSDDCIILSDEEEEDDDEDDENNSGEHTNDIYNKHDAEGRVIINIGHNEKEPDVFVAPQIAKIIKPHQIGGVRFLYDNIIESIELFDKSTGFGCILAHSMGLGKTLQLVCFCDIFLRHTNSKTILIIMPINTLQNWNNEFNMWIPLPEDVDKCPLNNQCEVRPRNFKIHVLNDSHKSLAIRSKVVLEWQKEGGVLMMGYEMFRLLSLKKVKQKRKKGGIHNSENDVPTTEDQDMFDKIYDALVNPGADLIVCDEGHRIKNASASTSLALKQVKTKRRIVLTGYPLQNNLLEYWCMVDFVRPSYLGTKTEFSNMFERPIQNGQCIDSTPQDCKLMRYRAHVLHSLLKGFVQRRSHSVLQKCLPDKTEHVLLIRLTPFQRKLYTVFMDEVVRSKKVPNPLKAFAVCCKIWNHPDVLYNFLKKRELDLEIELEENETDRKNEPASNIKKRGRKSKDKEKDREKDKVKQEEVINSTIIKKTEPEEINPIRLEVSKNIPQTSSDTFKPPVTPSSNDSAYSSNQSLSSSYEGPNTYNTYPSYQNYDMNNYQNYNYPNGNFSNWNNTNSNSYWQNNYYQPDNFYHPPNSYQPYYGNQQMVDSKTTPCNNASDQERTNIKVESLSNSSVDKNKKPILDGGLLADVIQKEAKEQQEKNNPNKDDIADTIVLKNSSRDDGIPYDWAVDLMKEYVPDLIENSPKLEIFLCILNESIKLGDRLLVFSQSLLTLNLLEKFLQRLKIPNTEKYWAKNQSYFRLDGSTAALERERLINEFNSNIDYKLFMVSTRAGSLGINLVGANRVIVFDASWNPCHDTQAICRVYRYGQTKPCYVYRFVVDNCLEKKIYDRQINKQGMADRVIDECNPDAHLSIKEVTSLCYDDGEDPDIKDFKNERENYHDVVMKKVLDDYPKALTKEPFQHESLLIDRKEKKLSQAEKRLAQRGYEMEKQAANKTTFNYNTVGNNYRLFRTPDGTLIQRPVISNNIPAIPTPNIQNPTIRAENPRPNRWVPVEVWQSKGIIAQEMTLPQDVSIQTNSADKSKIFLKAGQKIIVLKSPRGICLQLESGKVIAIRASMKAGQSNASGDLKNSGIPGIMEANDAGEFQNRKPLVNSDDVIDMTNSDDEDENNVKSTNNIHDSDFKDKADSKVVENDSNVENNKVDIVFKEKPVYKPNLVQRKPKIMPPPTTLVTTSVTSVNTTPSLQSNQSNFDTQSSSYDTNNYHKWNRFSNKSSTNVSNPPYQDLERNSRNNDQQPPFVNSYNPSNPTAVKSESNDENPPRENSTGNSSSAFHAPAFPNTFMQPPSQYSSHNSFPPYQNNSSNSSNNYNYPSSNYNYYQQPFSNPPRPYHYQPHNNYDPQYSYHHGYNQYPSTQILPSSYSTSVPTTTTTTTMTPSSSSNSNYSRWDWNK